MLYPDTYPELVDIVKGSTWKKFFDWLYKAAQLRYTTKDHLNALSKQFGTPKKLAKLIEAGFLTGVPYSIAPKAKEILKAEGYNTRTLQKDFNGLELKHALKITDAVLEIMAEPYFYAVIYPNFTEVIPDACLVFRNSGLLKVEMLEVEAEKPNWEDYLKEKKRKYEALGTNPDIYEKWWQVKCQQLGLPYGREFFFSVRCNSKIVKDWSGWKCVPDT